MNKEKIDNLVRDLCSVGAVKVKSKIRRRLVDLLIEERSNMIEECIEISEKVTAALWSKKLMK